MMLVNFSWVIDGKLAGMGQPPSHESVFETLDRKGVRAIVTAGSWRLSTSISRVSAR